MLTIEKDYLSCYRYSASGGARPGGNQSVMQRPDDVADQFDGQQLLAIFLPKYNRIDNDSDYAEATRYYPQIIHLSLFSIRIRIGAEALDQLDFFWVVGAVGGAIKVVEPLGEIEIGVTRRILVVACPDMFPRLEGLIFSRDEAPMIAAYVLEIQ